MTLPIQKQQIISDVKIIDKGVKGQAIAKHNNYVFLLDSGVPGDIVDIQVKRKKKSFYLAEILRLKSPSPHRTEVFCKHFEDCGGCKWQDIVYEKQLKLKEKSVKDAFIRIGKFTSENTNSILPAPELKYFRNKLEYSFAPKRWLTPLEIKEENIINQGPAAGFHVPGRFDKILDIDYCYLQSDISNDIRNGLKSFALNNEIDFNNPYTHKGLLRNLIIRNTTIGDLMVIMVFGENNNEKINRVMEYLKSEFPEINSLFYVVNVKPNDTVFDLEHILYNGKDKIREKIGDYLFDYGPKSFFQVNPKQTFNLFKQIEKYCEPQKNDVVYDLYCGVGTIGQFIANRVKKVIGLETVPESIHLAESNAGLNKIDNAYYFCGEVEKILNDDFFEKEGKADIIIVDPPRAGLHYKVIEAIKRIKPGKIIYVSCNPATQARDISLLVEHYNLKGVQPVDMFPHTYHVENVVLLKLR